MFLLFTISRVCGRMASAGRLLPGALAVLAGCLTLAWPAFARAAASDGVRCPNGYDTHYDAARKTMRCERSTPVYRPTVCDPAAPEHVLYRASKGRDFCVRPTDGGLATGVLPDNDARRRPAVCVGDDSEGLKWQLDIDAGPNERDRCRASRVDWIYPSQQ